MSSEHKVEVVRIGPVTKHPNADTLSITDVHGGYPVIFRTGDYNEGDLACYIPVDSMVPLSDTRFCFLAGKEEGLFSGRFRIRAKKLRGVFSMGLLIPADPEWVEGEDVTSQLGVTVYEPNIPSYRADDPDALGADCGWMPKYTDIDGWRRYKRAFQPGEQVVITEKIHGENARYGFDDGQMWVGSRNKIKKDTPTSKWWRVARSYGLEQILTKYPRYIIYGESCGYTGGFPYATPKGEASFYMFDVYDRDEGQYLGWERFLEFAEQTGIPIAPILYTGPYDGDIVTSLAEGVSTIDASHVREGVVVRPIVERWERSVGRVILKIHGEGFLIQTGKK